MPALLPGIELEQLVSCSSSMLFNVAGSDVSEPATRSLRLKGPQKKITLKNI